MKKIKRIDCDEDGETYVVVGNVTRRGAFRAILKFAREDCGLDEEYLPKMEDLEVSNFWETQGGYCDDWVWWSEPKKNDETYTFDTVKPIGGGWIYDVIEH